MRSKPGRYRKPTALEDAVSARVKELPYGSESEYVLGLIRYDLATRKDHTVTAGIAELPRSEQDKIDDEIARLCRGRVDRRKLVRAPPQGRGRELWRRERMFEEKKEGLYWRAFQHGQH